MPELPIGIVTFLFTDIEGSTTRWEQHPDVMKAALDRHDALLREAIGAQGGIVFQTAGDSLVAAFPTPGGGLAAALAGQRALLAESWPVELGPIRVRMALHTGPAELRDGVYHAEYTLNRLARLLAAGYGGQILCTATTRQLLDGATPAGTAWQDLGERWLKDLIRPLHVYQVLASGLQAQFPPLKSLDAPVAPASPAASATADVANPYKGLRAFQGADAPDFFGREALTDRLLARLGEGVPLARFLAVVGPSGSGKSSVVRAGVLPALRRGGLPGSEDWLIVEMIPGAAPMQELAAALGAVTDQDPDTLLAQLQTGEYGLLHVAERLVRVQPRHAIGNSQPVQFLLVIDQFEELFTLVTDETARVSFLTNLHRAVSAPDSPVRIILTLRADFYDRPLLYPDPGELVRQRTEVVLPLGSEELSRAITAPASRVGVSVEPALVGAMIRDVGEQPGTLPLLEYALTELFERREGNRLTLAAYQAGGGVQGALARRADEIYGGLAEREQTLARQLFLRLVTLGEGTEDTRRRVRRAELAALPVEADTLDGVLETFSRYRLLTFDREPGTGEPTVEVAHEALIRTWGRLREWLDTSRADLRVQRQLGAEAAEWARAAQDPSYLASGARLEQFEALATAGELALTGDEQTYLAASVAERERRKGAEQARQVHELQMAREAAEAQRSAAGRLRVLLGAMVIFLTVALGLSLFAFDRQRAALAGLARSDALRLAAEANKLVLEGGSSYDVALLAIRSLNSQYTPQGDAAIEAAAMLSYPRRRFLGHTENVVAVAFSPDGKYVLTGSHDNTARLWDPASGQEIRRFTNTGTGNENITSVAFAPDGKTILTGSLDQTARLWDVATGQEVRRFVGHSGAVWSVAFSADGKTVLTAGGGDNTARLWDAATGRELRRFVGHGNTVNSAVFAPAGQTVLTGSADGTVRLWDAATGRELRRFSAANPVVQVAFAPDGHTVLGGILGGTGVAAQLWDAATGQTVRSFTVLGNVWSVAFAPDSKSVLTGGSADARLWDAGTGKELRRYAAQTARIGAVAFAPDGKSILTGSDDDTALLWDLQPTPEHAVFPGVIGALYLPDGRQVVGLLGDQATIVLLDPATGAITRRYAPTASTIWTLAVSPDGRYLLTGQADKIAHIRDLTTGAEVQRLVGHTDRVSGAAWTPDGKAVLTGSQDGTARLWDVTTGKELHQFPPGGWNAMGVAVSPDGRLLLTSCCSGVAVLDDRATGAEVRRFAGSQFLGAAAFSPDGKYVVTADTGPTAHLWAVATGREVRRFTGHTAAIGAATGLVVDFSPDGQWVLTGSSDNTARLWNVATGQETRRFTGHTAGLLSARIAPDGRTVLTAGFDGLARLWDTDHHDTIRYLCGRLLGRDLLADERTQYSIADAAPTCPQP